MNFGRFKSHPIAHRLLRVAFFEVDGNQEEVAKAILPEIEIRGVRFWFLICACVIASIGLNTDSAAVIIGAMLVSPLMGPILGLGFGLATRSRRTTVLAARNLAWAILASLFLSTVYFALSPLDQATSELLARTQPTLLDLFVAIASALAGVIALTSRSAASIVPGVAIATAIMPPLCTVGYGISQGSPRIAFGAFYLFLVNALAIALVAFFLFKRMHFHETDEERVQKQTLSWAVTASLILLFLAPLGWTLHRLWKDTYVQRQVHSVVRKAQDELEIVNWRYERGSRPRLILYAFRKAPESLSTKLERDVQAIDPGASLVIRYGSESEEAREILHRVKSSPLFPILSDQDALSRLLGASASKTQGEQKPSGPRLAIDYGSLARELSAIADARVLPSFFLVAGGDQADGEDRGPGLILLRHPEALTVRQKRQIEERVKAWLKVRLPEAPEPRVLWERAAASESA